MEWKYKETNGRVVAGENSCKNKGQCIPINNRINNKDFICLCTEEYTGLNCEYKSNQININFHKEIIRKSTIYIYIAAATTADIMIENHNTQGLNSHLYYEVLGSFTKF